MSAGRVRARASGRACVMTIPSSPLASWTVPRLSVQSMLYRFCASEPVERARVLAADLPRHRLGQVANQPLLGVGRVDARVVARVEQHVVGAELVHYAEELARIGRPVERLDREVHVLADVLRRRTLHPRYEPAEVLPLLVEAPHMGWQPGETGLDQGDPQRGELVEDALGDDA